MSNPNTLPKITRDRLVQIWRSPELKEATSRQGKTIHAVEVAALSLARAQRSKPEHSSRDLIEASQLEVIAGVGSFADSLAELDALDDQEATFTEKEPQLVKVAEFEKQVRSMVSLDTGMNLKDAGEFIVTSYVTTHRHAIKEDEWRDRLSHIQHGVGSLLSRVRNSIIGEQVYGLMPEIDKYNSDIDAESMAQGYTAEVTVDGVTFPIRLLGSLEAVGNSRERSREPENILWTGVKPAEVPYNDFRIDPKVAQTKQSAVRVALQEALEAEKLARGIDLAAA